MDNIEEVIKIIKESKKCVFFGGAGVSTESGIKDFRSTDGLYNQKYDYPPEQILSKDFFLYNTDEFFKFYREKMNPLDYNPNITHETLALMEQKNILSCIITQNIDGLHQKAGSKNVLELHGSVHNNHCTNCKKFYDANFIFKNNGIPTCDCGGIIKPDVVLYQEPLDENILNRAIKEISEADNLIVGGTSLVVYPAAGLIKNFKGNNIILINKDKTFVDDKADIVIHENLGKVFEKIKEAISK